MLYCSPFSLQSLDPCSMSVYSCFGFDLNIPIRANTTYITVKYNKLFPKIDPYPCENTLVIDVKLVTSEKNFSINMSNLNTPLTVDIPIE